MTFTAPQFARLLRRLRSIRMLLLAAVCLGGAAVALQAQQWMRGEGAAAPFRYGMPDAGVQGGFTFCRLWFDRVRSFASGVGWGTDYPRGDQNFVTRLAQLTHVRTTRWSDGMPGHAAFRADDKILFTCPFLFAVDAGTMGLSDAEIKNLREYLLKGGFLWVDDFWGEPAWQFWTETLRRILPEYTIEELPPDHRLFNTFYVIQKVPQIPSMQHWTRNNGDTAEFGTENKSHMLAVFDEHGRIMVLMTHNTDIGDGWEREADSHVYFQLFSPQAYAIGMNVAIWVLTH